MPGKISSEVFIQTKTMIQALNSVLKVCKHGAYYGYTSMLILLAVNNARDVLCDPRKRNVYDSFIKDNPLLPEAETFGEDFAQNAYDETGSDDNDEYDDEDGEDDIEASYPRPNQQIRQLHSQMTCHIRAFFASLKGQIGLSWLAEIETINIKIEEENEGAAIPMLHMVPKRTLLGLQYHQRSIVMRLETNMLDTAGAMRSALGLQRHFMNTCQRGLYSWPTKWVGLLMDPLYRRIEMQNIPTGQQLFPKADSSAYQYGRSVGMESGVPAGTPPVSNDDDIEMEDVYDITDEDIRDASQNPGRVLRPGFTICGQPILGYFPITRRVAGGATAIMRFTIFVKINSINPMKIASNAEVGDPFAYHELPDDKRNDIRESAAKYAGMSPSEFVDILGIAYLSSTSTTRLPATYIWVDTRTSFGKPTIVTKTTLRKWLGERAADARIDSWLADKGITPEWKVLDLASDSRHLQLTHTTPARSSRQSRSRARAHARPTSHREDSQIDGLTKAFDRMTEAFQKIQEEAREDRKQHREIMQRLLPAPR